MSNKLKTLYNREKDMTFKAKSRQCFKEQHKHDFFQFQYKARLDLRVSRFVYRKGSQRRYTTTSQSRKCKKHKYLSLTNKLFGFQKNELQARKKEFTSARLFAPNFLTCSCSIPACLSLILVLG